MMFENGHLEIVARPKDQFVDLTIDHPDFGATVTFQLSRDMAFQALEKLRTACAALLDRPDDPSRCAICGWPLESESKAGCVRGNCSQRPRPERLYAPERAAREAADRG
jgi:hypothetical protein